jgi:hypothetical protein
LRAPSSIINTVKSGATNGSTQIAVLLTVEASTDYYNAILDERISIMLYQMSIIKRQYLSLNSLINNRGGYK